MSFNPPMMRCALSLHFLLQKYKLLFDLFNRLFLRSNDFWQWEQVRVTLCRVCGFGLFAEQDRLQNRPYPLLISLFTVLKSLPHISQVLSTNRLAAIDTLPVGGESSMKNPFCQQSPPLSEVFLCLYLL